MGTWQSCRDLMSGGDRNYAMKMVIGDDVFNFHMEIK